jgi:cytochrome c553
MLCGVKGQAMTNPDLKAEIAQELYTALERLRADDERVAIVEDWRDRKSDEQFLRLLQAYNARMPPLR